MIESPERPRPREDREPSSICTETPGWLKRADFVAARDDEGDIIGVKVTFVVEHHDLVDLPPEMMDTAHKTIDRAAARDARGGR